MHRTIAGRRAELDGQPSAHDLASGFRPEDRERLFDGFYTTTARRENGFAHQPLDRRSSWRMAVRDIKRRSGRDIFLRVTGRVLSPIPKSQKISNLL